MNREEAGKILSAHLQSFRLRSYTDLLSLMGDVQVAEVLGPSGAEYQIEIDVMWDSPREKTNILVSGIIDDGRFLAAIVVEEARNRVPVTLSLTGNRWGFTGR